VNAIAVYLVGLVITVGIVFAALLYLRNPLRVILTDLCGTPERTHFWTAFSNVILFLVPFVLALHCKPGADGSPVTIFEISGQMEAGLIGLAISVLVLGMVLNRYVPRIHPKKPSKETDGHLERSAGESTAI
jgi:hypothetical protein